jgi:hypothetical protein
LRTHLRDFQNVTTQSTLACCGGFRYKPTTSVTVPSVAKAAEIGLPE